MLSTTSQADEFWGSVAILAALPRQNRSPCTSVEAVKGYLLERLPICMCPQRDRSLEGLSPGEYLIADIGVAQMSPHVCEHVEIRAVQTSLHPRHVYVAISLAALLHQQECGRASPKSPVRERALAPDSTSPETHVVRTQKRSEKAKILHT